MNERGKLDKKNCMKVQKQAIWELPKNGIVKKKITWTKDK